MTGEYTKSYRKRQIERGLCTECPNQAALPHKTCAVCSAKNAKWRKERRLLNYNLSLENDKKYRELRHKNNMCIRCGTPLGEHDDSYKNCFNCRHRKTI